MAARVQSDDQVPRWIADYISDDVNIESETSSLASDAESDTTTDEDATMPLWQHYNRNLLNLQDKLRTWTTTDIGQGRTVIDSVTASKIPSNMLHPSLYRNMAGFSDPNAFANHLGIINWMAEYARVRQDLMVNYWIQRLIRIDSSQPEAEVERIVTVIIQSVAHVLRIPLDQPWKTRYTMGGLLADSHYYYRGISDSCFKDLKGNQLIKTEIKTGQSFRLGAKWYGRTRGTQTFGALFAKNNLVPTLLMTSEQFKVFVPSADRTQIMAYPTGYQTQPTSSQEFLQVICICLLKGEQATPPPSVDTSRVSSPTPHIAPTEPTTDKQVTRKRRRRPSQAQPTRSSERLKKLRQPEPTAESCYIRVSEQGQPPEFRAIVSLSEKEMDELEKRLGPIVD